MKKFSNYIEEMSMSVTLKPKKNNMYKVTKVGSKMKKHGGIKPGEKFHDREIDGMHDSGIKVKYESNDSMQRMADTWNDHADHPHPKVKKHIKAAEKAYNNQDHEGFYNHTQRAADHAYMLKQKKKTNEEKMAGQEYRTQMAKVKSKNPAIRKAISNIYDKKPGKDIDHPEVKAAKKYMKTEASYADVLKKRYASDHPDDNPQATKRIKDHIPGMKTYKAHPGVKHQPSTGTYSKKGKMAALKKQLDRRPAQYGVTHK